MAQEKKSTRIHLSAIDSTPPKELKKKKIVAKTEKLIQELNELQYKFSAVGDRALLIILQGIDASGKDGTMRHVFSGLNPTSITTTGFRAPSKEEAGHDFLWRVHAKVPSRGEIGFFNRSHYEDILVPSVSKTVNKKTIEQRYQQINDFEKMLEQNGVIIIKFYLHISQSRQKEKLNERLTNPLKYWKHNIGDRDTRAQFDDYMKVYEEILERCNQPKWHLIPADKNRYKHYLIAFTVVDVLKKLNLERPELDQDERTLELQKQALKELEQNSSATSNKKSNKK